MFDCATEDFEPEDNNVLMDACNRAQAAYRALRSLDDYAHTDDEASAVVDEMEAAIDGFFDAPYATSMAEFAAETLAYEVIKFARIDCVDEQLTLAIGDRTASSFQNLCKVTMPAHAVPACFADRIEPPVPAQAFLD